MPIVNITLGQITDEKKAEIIERTTQTLMEITGLGEESFMTTINELPYENLGKGTKTIAKVLEELNA